MTSGSGGSTGMGSSGIVIRLVYPKGAAAKRPQWTADGRPLFDSSLTDRSDGGRLSGMELHPIMYVADQYAGRAFYELFGFERTSNLSCAPAKNIAEAALRFGQADDITVISVVAKLE